MKSSFDLGFGTLGMNAVTLAGSTVMLGVIWFLIEVSAKNFLLLSVAALVCCLAGRATAAFRHVIWASTLSALVLMPVLSLCVPNWQVLPVNSYELGEDQHVGVPPTALTPIGTDELVTSTKKRFETSSPVTGDSAARNMRSTTLPDSGTIRVGATTVLTIWMIGFLGCSLPMVFSAILLFRLSRSRDLVAESCILDQVDEICRQLGIRTPNVLLGAEDQMPMVWQFFRSYLLVPGDAFTWSDDRTKAVLLHELVHLKRRDPVMLWVGQLARAGNWFNPLVWYAFTQMRMEQERACDDFVLRSGVRPDHYASHLLDLSTSLQSKFAQEVVALSMASSSKVENRLKEVLNPQVNRKGLGSVWCFGLFICVASVAITLSSLASGTSVASETRDEDSELVFKWPHCEIGMGQDERSLESAILEFNDASKVSPIGQQEEPLTAEELVGKVRDWLENGGLSDELSETLSTILKKERLPANAVLRRFTRFDDGVQMHGVWWVQLIVESNGRFISKTIRKKHLYSRPYTLPERQQADSGSVSLINRVSSYYETVPQPVDEQRENDTAIQFAEDFRELLVNKQQQAILKLFNRNKVSQSLVDFFKSEVMQLANSKIESVRFQPSLLEGKLITWKAFHRYGPNLPVEGYLAIRFRDEESGQIGEKQFELGRNANGKHVLVGYVIEKRVPMPKTFEPGMSLQSQLMAGKIATPIEPKIFPVQPIYMTWSIHNPGKLLSAHLANEEIWLRDVPGIQQGEQENKRPSENLRGMKIETNDKPEWGEVLDGLKAAVILEEKGGKIQISYEVMNASDHEIEFESENWRQNDRFWVWTDEEDRRPVATRSVFYTGWPIITAHLLKPGGTVRLHSGVLNINPPGTDADKALAEPYGIVAGPGRYLIQYELNIPGFVRENDYWKGVLKTGKTSFEIKP